MDPVTIAVALIGGASTVLGAAMTEAPKMMSSSAPGFLTSDNSGFVVNTGSGSASGSRDSSALPDWLLIAGAVAVFLYLRK